MKKTIIALAGMLAISTAASAKMIDTVSVDIENDTVTVKGTLGETLNGKLLTLKVLEGGVEINEKGDNIKYADIMDIDETGVYEKTFGFTGENGDYTLVAVDETGAKETEVIHYFNKKEIDDVAQKIGKGEITGSDIIAKINKYAQILNADTEYFADERNQGILLDEIESNKKKIESGMTSALQEVIKTTNDKCLVLDNIENSKTWYEVENYIKTNADLLGIELDDYNKVNDKSKVCSEFIGIRQKSMSAFQDEFNELVKNNQPTNSGSGGSSGGGGGGGGGGVRPSYTGGQTYTPHDEIKRDDVPPAVEPSTVFSDVPQGHWANEAIETLFNDGVVSGMGDGTFAPEQIVTRGEAAKIITLAFEMNIDSVKSEFTDVPVTAWQYPYVSALFENKVTTGITDTLYGVDDPVTRQDLAVLLYRVLDLKGKTEEVKKTDFADFDTVSDYAVDAVATMAGMGIINGTDNNCFAPYDDATRAQTAKLVYEMTMLLK